MNKRKENRSELRARLARKIIMAKVMTKKISNQKMANQAFAKTLATIMVGNTAPYPLKPQQR